MNVVAEQWHKKAKKNAENERTKGFWCCNMLSFWVKKEKGQTKNWGAGEREMFKMVGMQIKPSRDVTVHLRWEGNININIYWWFYVKRYRENETELHLLNWCLLTILKRVMNLFMEITTLEPGNECWKLSVTVFNSITGIQHATVSMPN